MTDKTKLIQLEMPEKAYERLKSLKGRTEASSYADVVKNALRLYEALIDETENGGILYLKSGEGTETKIKPIF